VNPPFRLFATLRDGKGSRCRIFCDGRQNFLFEHSLNGIVVERFRSSDPNRFHRYTYELGARGWDFAWAPPEGG
jgi:hypothetical protein